MIVVSDTTPLISLLKINRLDLLERLFGKVFIPDAVKRKSLLKRNLSIIQNLPAY